MTDQAQADAHKEYVFYVDANRFTTQSEFLTGAQIKAQAGVTANYQLFLEEEGDKPDKPISDGERVEMRRGEDVRHFYAVPPATFGIR